MGTTGARIKAMSGYNGQGRWLNSIRHALLACSDAGLACTADTDLSGVRCEVGCAAFHGNVCQVIHGGSGKL